MNKLNKSNITLIAIRKRKKTGYSNCFNLVIANKSGHNKFFVIEKIGSIDFHFKKIYINFFRLIFWLRFNISVDVKAWKILEMFILGKNW